MQETYKRGDRVRSSGRGRTSMWGNAPHRGTVISATKRSVFIQWDGTHFSDEIAHSEVEPELTTAATQDNRSV